MSQSEARMTSRLCSITTSEWQAGHDFVVVVEGGDRRLYGEVEDVRDVAAVHTHFEYLVAITRAVAIGTAQVDVGEELHLHVLEPAAGAGRTTSIAGVEAEGS